jgi:hypothetical protein
MCIGGTAFCIVDPKMMAEHCLPKYFRHKRFSSLIRQLNFYSFYRVQEGQLTIYQHSFFRKGRPDLLVHIKRRGAGKAKDPWFDPLAPSNKIQPGQPKPGMFGVSPTVGPANGVLCYSPLSKPLTIENMSPAMKPGMAQVTPPIVELNSGATGAKIAATKNWQGHPNLKENIMYAASEAPMKIEYYIPSVNTSASTNSVAPTSRPIQNPVGTTFDIDIQDFLTDDCTIKSSISESKTEDRCLNSNGVTKGVVSVARDCLKRSPNQEQVLNHHESNDAIDDELLRDLASVEPEAWEVPLSPLNEEEDVMPWLDLCF